jgi:predicted Zn-dependent protease
MEVRGSVPLPRASEDVERGQHRAVELLGLLRTAFLQTKPGELVGAAEGAEAPRTRPDGTIFVTDADLFTAKSDGVYAAINAAKGIGVISVRRLREAFYRRPADPARQRSRTIKEILRVAARLRGMPQCPDPACVLAPSKSIPDLDTKAEAYCRPCAQRLFEGRIRV